MRDSRDSGDNYAPIEVKEKKSHFSFRLNLPKPPPWFKRILWVSLSAAIGSLITIGIDYYFFPTPDCPSCPAAPPAELVEAPEVEKPSLREGFQEGIQSGEAKKDRVERTLDWFKERGL